MPQQPNEFVIMPNLKIQGLIGTKLEQHNKQYSNNVQMHGDHRNNNCVFSKKKQHASYPGV